jgi:hypothetical protein
VDFAVEALQGGLGEAMDAALLRRLVDVVEGGDAHGGAT